MVPHPSPARPSSKTISRSAGSPAWLLCRSTVRPSPSATSPATPTRRTSSAPQTPCSGLYREGEMNVHIDDRSVSEHYGRGDLAAKVFEALRAAGKDPDALTTED